MRYRAPDPVFWPKPDPHPCLTLYSIYSKVMDDDARNFTSGEFFSDARGKVPPLVTTKFITRDAGNSGMIVRKWVAGI